MFSRVRKQQSYKDGILARENILSSDDRANFLKEIIVEGGEQDNSVFKVIHSKLKTAVLLKANIDEHLSSLTDMTLYIKILDDINVKEILGTQISIEIIYDPEQGYEIGGQKKRYFSGTIVEASFEVVPVIDRDHITKSNILCVRAMSTFSKCNYIKTYNIFIKKKPDDLIKSLLQVSGISDVKIQVSSGKEKEITTQYNETNLEFISRLMEENGYFYFFKHENGKDTLNIVDKNGGCPKMPTKLISLKTTGKNDFDNVFNLSLVQSGGIKEVEITSYDTKTAKIVSSSAKNNDAKSGKISMFDIAFDSKSDGDKIAKLEIERHASLDKYISADCLCCEIGAGFVCKIDGAEDNNCNGDFLVVGANHVIDIYAEDGALYRNSFIAVKSDVVFRPQRMHEKPVKHGAYIATVVDKDGKIDKDIDIDDAGMILVEFPFGMTSRVRCANIVANNNFGATCYHRPGAEVLVIFANGDIDNPIVIGSLYNGPNTMHKDCKAQEITSLTTKTVDGEGYNQVIFDDKKNEERIQFHAQKDWILITEKGDIKEILAEGSKVTEFKNEEEEANNVLKIKKGNNIVDIEEGDNIIALKKGNCQIVVEEGDGTLELKKGDHVIKVKDGAILITSKKKISIQSEDGIDIQADKDISIKSGSNIAIEAEKDIIMSSNANIQYSAKQKMLCKANMDCAIEGMNLKLSAKMNTEIGANVQMKIAGAMTDVEAKAILGLKGAVVNVG